jgi:hypothetical protein
MNQVSLIGRRSVCVAMLLGPLLGSRAWADVAQRTVDKRNATEAGEYGIGFSAKASDDGYDHAFIVWYYSDPKGMRTVRRGAGFYPVASPDTKSYDLIFGITGMVFDDSKVKVDRELTVLVNKDVFDRAIAVEQRYQNGHTYHLALDDCTTFVTQVASAIPGLTVPNRVTHLYPSSYISALFDANR